MEKMLPISLIGIASDSFASIEQDMLDLRGGGVYRETFQVVNSKS